MDTGRVITTEPQREFPVLPFLRNKHGTKVQCVPRPVVYLLLSGGVVHDNDISHICVICSIYYTIWNYTYYVAEVTMMST